MNMFLTLLTNLRPEVSESSKTLFNTPIAWYAIIIMSGALIGTFFGYFRYGKRLGIDSDTVFTGLTIGLLLGIIGARLYYVLFTADKTQYQSFLDVINPRSGGLAIHGGVIVAAIYLPIYCKIKKIKLLTLLEIALPLILFAQVVGRWGNFVNQEAFGELVKVEELKNYGDLNRFTVLSDEVLLAQRAALSKLLVPNFVINRMYIQSSSASGFICSGYYYPTFYFESMFNLIGIIAYMISRKYIKQIKVGDGISFYLIWYGAVRFFIETQRTDALTIGNTNIRIAEVISILFIIAGLVWIILRRVLKIEMVSCYEALYGENASARYGIEEKKSSDEQE